jgi:hypothetical protein
MRGHGRGRAARALAALLGACCALGAAELGARAWLAWRGTPWSAAAARERAARIAEELSGRLGWEGADAGGDGAYDNLVLHPYYGYDSANAARAKERVVEALASPHPGELCVLLVGGSVAALFNSSTDGGKDELARLIAADPRAGDRRVRVLGHARPGFKQPQQLHVVADLLRQGAVPDVVLNLDGFNELDLAVGNARAGLPADWPSHTHWLHVSAPPADPRQLDALVDEEGARRAALAEAERLDASPLLASALLGPRALGRLEELASRASAAAAERDALRAPEPPPGDFDTGAAVAQAVEIWSRSSAELARLCAASGVRYVHALQPTLHDRGSKPLTPEEERDGLRGGWREPVLAGYPLLRAAGADLSAQGVRFCDVSDAFQGVQETLYYDPCHFSRRGNLLLAARLADAVLAALE